MKFKDEAIRTGNCCPYCNSDYITAISDFNTESNMAWRTVKCNSCKSEWDEVFEIVNLDPRKENGKYID